MLTGSLTKWAAPCQACPCQAQAETEEGLDLAMLLLGVLKSCTFTPQRHTRSLVCVHTHTHTHTHIYMVALQPLSVCQNVSQDVLAPANQARDSAWQTPPQQESSCHLDKWTLEEWGGVCVCVCVGMCMFVQPCICVCGFTPVCFCSSISTCIVRMTHRWLMYMWFFAFSKAAGLSILDWYRSENGSEPAEVSFCEPLSIPRKTLLKICTSCLAWRWVLFKVTLAT